MSYNKGIIGVCVLTLLAGLGAFAFLPQTKRASDLTNNAPPRSFLPLSATAQAEQKLSMILVGDIMLDREVYRQTLASGDFALG